MLKANLSRKKISIIEISILSDSAKVLCPELRLANFRSRKIKEHCPRTESLNPETRTHHNLAEVMYRSRTEEKGQVTKVKIQVKPVAGNNPKLTLETNKTEGNHSNVSESCYKTGHNTRRNVKCTEPEHVTKEDPLNPK